MKHTVKPANRLLPRALLANAAFSTTTGLALLLWGRPIADTIGAVDALALRFLGAGLLVFASFVAFSARRPQMKNVGAIIAGDIGWLVGSAFLLGYAHSAFTTAGVALIISIALVVALLAALQLAGVRHSVSASRSSAPRTRLSVGAR